MFVPDKRDKWLDSRLNPSDGLQWQPYLFVSVFIGALLTLVTGSPDVYPPGSSIDGLDWFWVIGALFSCPVAFGASWLMKHKSGMIRYISLWLRLAASIGVITSIVAYQAQRISSGQGHPFEDVILLASVVYMSVLVVRDVQFLTLTEQVATLLRKRELDRESISCALMT